MTESLEPITSVRPTKVHGKKLVSGNDGNKLDQAVQVMLLGYSGGSHSSTLVHHHDDGQGLVGSHT